MLPIKTTKNIQFIVFFVAESSRARAKSFISFLLANIFDRQEHKENWYRIFAQSNFYLFSYLLRSKTVNPKIVTKTLLLMMSRLQARLLELEDQTINGNTHLKHLMQSIELPLLVLQTIIMIVLEHRALDNQEVSEAFRSLLAEATPKLHFHYFLNEKVLGKLGLPSHRSNPLRLKFSNKFLPSTLPKTGVMMDQLMVLGEMEEEQPEGS